MRGRFAVMMCPEPDCVKIGLAKTARCPTHDKAMVRTAVMTDKYVRAHNKLHDSLADILKGYK